jgi:hypothetical protein
MPVSTIPYSVTLDCATAAVLAAQSALHKRACTGACILIVVVSRPLFIELFFY